MPLEPTQSRAERRRASLLNAAAAILERAGFEAVNTNAIAQEAGAAVGTVYHYFPDKPALLLALLDRYRARLEQMILGALGPVVDEPLTTMVDVGVRAFADFYAHEPGYAELWLGSQLSGPLREASASWGGHFSDLFGQLLVQRLQLERDVATRRAAVFVHAVSAIVSLAVQREEPERAALVEEAIALGQAYLGPRTSSTSDR